MWLCLCVNVFFRELIKSIGSDYVDNKESNYPIDKYTFPRVFNTPNRSLHIVTHIRYNVYS